jgi:heavy metal sensor kinase
MVRSIRWRLQIWYAAVLLAVVAGLAGLLYLQARSARLRQVDEQLEGSINYLEATLRGFPPHELDDHVPPMRRPRRPPPEFGDGRKDDGPRRPPPPPPRRDPREMLELPGARKDDNLEAEQARPYFAIWRGDGRVLKATPTSEPITRPDPSSAPDFGEPPMTRWQRGSFREMVMSGPHGTLILVGKPFHRELAELRAFAWQLAGSGAAVLAVGLVGGWLISARILRPIAAISATAAAISARSLSRRIDVAVVDRELVELARVLNEMFARLEAAFERQARFTADASHELRTPLAVLHSHVELALARPRAPDDYQDILRACLGASARMRSLVDGLLTLARADAGRLELEHKPVDLRQLVEEVTAQHAPQADQAGIALSASVPSRPVVVAGDATFLSRVAANLLANALRHTPSGGQVRTLLDTEGDQARLAVADTGSGIPEEDQPRIFERFFRVDRARSRASGGSGLGLAICKSLVEAHRGSIDFTSYPERGSTFTVRLPLSCEKTGTGSGQGE